MYIYQHISLGWFEPDDDETVRAKSKEYYGFGDYPKSVVFDKVIY